MRIYVASSWKNIHFDQVVKELRDAGHEVYSFRNPDEQGPKIDSFTGGSTAFSWKEISPHPERWSLEEYKEVLKTPMAINGYFADKAAMDWAEGCVLVLPSGKSVHTEFGWFTGKGKKAVAYLPPITMKCPSCSGTGSYSPLHWIPRGCPACVPCEGSGTLRTWNFEPELMYLLGGDADKVLAFSVEEILERLPAPGTPAF